MIVRKRDTGQSSALRPADRPKPPPRVAPPPRAIRPPRTRPSRAARAAPGLLVRATRPMPRTQPLRGRRRRHRRRRRRRRTLVLILTPCSPCSSTCTCSSRRSFSFCRCTPIWAMRGGSGCAASAWGAPPLGDHGCVAWVCAAKSRNLVLPDPLSRTLVLVCALRRCLRLNITVHQKWASPSCELHFNGVAPRGARVAGWERK